MTSPTPFRVLGVAGSLRRGSFNRALIDTAADLAGTRLDIVAFDLEGIPMFNADVEKAGDPEPVVLWKQAIADADGLLISTPEYQRGVPGVLKNALDWASRPPGESALRRKPAAIMGAATGMTGTARAQSQLRQTLVYNDCQVVQRPEVLVADARSKFDEDGTFQDETGKKFLSELLDKLVEIMERAGD
ncbi:MAG TPA: NAD(P)H-dependent oxidoreductase [Acidimicrobiia bacterium]|nr:NAD(P)H-dependent oxidoreductase [Acidimicrobiia bacterium]